MSLRERDRAITHIATHPQIHYNFGVEYPFPPVGIVGAADGKNRRAFLCVFDVGFEIEGLTLQAHSKQKREAFLPEVVVMSQDVIDAEFAHRMHRNTIRQTVAFVRSCFV